jgi:hypothetical protein
VEKLALVAGETVVVEVLGRRRLRPLCVRALLAAAVATCARRAGVRHGLLIESRRRLRLGTAPVVTLLTTVLA